jgi:hypothetical protein
LILASWLGFVASVGDRRVVNSVTAMPCHVSAFVPVFTVLEWEAFLAPSLEQSPEVGFTGLCHGRHLLHWSARFA